MSELDITKLDPALHSPVRIGIMTVLSTNIEADFNYLKKSMDVTDGNLSSHLSKLEQIGFVKITKGFAGKKTRTTCRITEKGTNAFKSYIEALENIIKKSKTGKSK